jgi:hypothetical protein
LKLIEIKNSPGNIPEMQDPYDPSQIYIDYNTRYPEYSEPEAAFRPRMMNYNKNSYEDNFQTAQQGYPTSYGCNMYACPDAEWPQKYTVKNGIVGGKVMYVQPTPQHTSVHTTPQPTSTLEGFGAIQTSPEIIFMFLVLVIMLALVIKSLADVKKVLKSIQKSGLQASRV